MKMFVHYSELELAYCAGVIDSDGTIGIRKTLVKEKGKTPYIHYYEQVQVGQVEKDAVELLHKLFGGSITIRHVKNHRDLFVWRVVSCKANDCLRSLISSLRIKIKQASNCIEFRDFFDQLKKQKRTVKGLSGSKPRSKQTLEKLDSFYKKARILNRTLKGN